MRGESVIRKGIEVTGEGDVGGESAGGESCDAVKAVNNVCRYELMVCPIVGYCKIR